MILSSFTFVSSTICSVLRQSLQTSIFDLSDTTRKYCSEDQHVVISWYPFECVPVNILFVPSRLFAPDARHDFSDTEEFSRVQVLHPFYNENEIWGPHVISSLMVIAFLLFTNTNLSTLLELPSSVNRSLISWLCLKLCADYPCHLDRASKTCHILLKYPPIVSTSTIPSPTHLQFVFPSCSTPEYDSVEFLSGSIIVSLERADPRNTEISRIRFWVSICQEKQFKYH